MTVTALVLASIVGVLLGLLAARKRGTSLDFGGQTISLFGYSIPEFWLGQILIVIFAVSLGWLPSQGNRSLRAPAEGWAAITDSLRYLILPVSRSPFATWQSSPG